MNKGEMIIYNKSKDFHSIEVKLIDENVWLNLNQITNLFGRDKSVISRHINNVFAEKELEREAVVAKFATTAEDGKIYMVDYYNLDVIISIGYRVKSVEGTKFRIWANKTLKEYLIKGYVINQKKIENKRLIELEETIKLIKNSYSNKQLSEDETKGLLDIVTGYTNSWLLLQKYDENKLKAPKKLKTPQYTLTYEEAKNAINTLKKDLISRKEATEIFGIERENMLKAVVGGLYQTFDGKDLYPSIEEKASHLLYFVIKDHPFSDGNKRIGSFLFILFLEKNGFLRKENGELKINDIALVAIALIVATSDPKQKEIMTNLIMNFITNNPL